MNDIDLDREHVPTDLYVADETFHNVIARWYHLRVHKSGKTWYCESDRKFAADLLSEIRRQPWDVIENKD